MVMLLGFHGPIPYSMIIWQRDGQDHSKTVCYSKEDETIAIRRFYTQGDHYNKAYDKAIIIRGSENKQVLEKRGVKHGCII